MQWHVGTLLITRHSAFKAQTPGQGSLHLLLRQAKWLGHSLFITHCGRQPLYGSPKYSGMHLHAPAPFFSIQSAFAPHGFGEHGCWTSSCLTVGKYLVILMKKIIWCLLYKQRQEQNKKGVWLFENWGAHKNNQNI